MECIQRNLVLTTLELLYFWSQVVATVGRTVARQIFGWRATSRQGEQRSVLAPTVVAACLITY